MRRPNFDYVMIVVAGAILTALLVLAVFLVNRESSGAVAADAEVAIHAESMMSAAAGVVNATNFAVVLAVNTTEPELVAEARKGAEEAIEELGERSDRLAFQLSPDLRNQVVGAHGRFQSATQEALGDLENLDGVAGSAVLGDQAAGYRELVDVLAELRDVRTAEILVAGEGVGRAADAVRFLVVFLLPLGVVIAVWKAIRRSAAQRILNEELRHAKDESRSKDQFIADVSP